MKFSTILVLLPQVVRSATDWNVGVGSIVNTNDNILTVKHDVGAEADGVMVELFGGIGCTGTPLDVTNDYIKIQKPEGETCWTDFQYEIDVNKNEAQNENNNFKDGSFLKFCVKTISLEDDANGQLQVNFAKTNFELDFSKNLNDVAFTAVTYDVTENDVGEVTQDYSVQGTVTACVCSAASVVCETGVTLNQDDFVFICLSPEQGFSITDFFMDMDTPGATQYKPVTSGPTPNAVTTIENVGLVKKVKTPIIRSLVEDSTEASKTITVTGQADLAIANVSGPAPKRMGEGNQFEMEITVNTNCEGNGIIGKLLGSD